MPAPERRRERRLDGARQRAEVPALPAPERTPMRRLAFTVFSTVATVLALGFLLLPVAGDLPARLARRAARAARRPRRPRRARRHREDERDRIRAHAARRDAGRVPARDAALPGPPARRHALRAPARAAARRSPGSGSSQPSGGSGCSAARSTRSASGSASRRRPSCSRPVRRRAVLPPPGDRRLRGGRPDAARRRAHARRRPGRARSSRVALPLAGGGLERGCRALARPRDRRVRRDDHVRRQPPGRDADALAGDLRAVRRRLHAGARDGRAARRRSARPSCSRSSWSRHGGARPRRRRSSSLLRARASARGRARDVRARRPVGGGQDDRAARVAGLVRPARGRIELDGRRRCSTPSAASTRPPEERRVGLVFQEYALFPHLSVEANVAFGGRERACTSCSSGSGSRTWRKARPGELSGGERQRVALARALARDPAVLLLDEPMAALDAHTRAGVRAELQELLRELALPTILVTHDFEDAAALADRVGVIVRGPGPPARDAGRARRRARPTPSSPSFTGGNLLHGFARLGARGPDRGRARRRRGRLLDRPRPRAASASSSTRGRCRSRRPSRRPRLGAEPRQRADLVAGHDRQPRARPGRPARRRGDRRIGGAPRTRARPARRRLVQGDRRAARSAARRLNASNVRTATASESVGGSSARSGRGSSAGSGR